MNKLKPWLQNKSLTLAQLLYFVLVATFVYLQEASIQAPQLQFWTEIFALLLLPTAILASKPRDFTEVVSHSFHIFVESMVALATGVLLVGAKDLLVPGSYRILPNKVPEIALVFILVFAVQTVSKSSGLFGDAVERLRLKIKEVEGKSAELNSSVGKFTEMITEMKRSAEQVQEARYAGLAARVLEVKNKAGLMIRNKDGVLSPDTVLTNIAERALDSFEAWIKAGDRIDERGAGADGRSTWWWLMEAYHREEIFDITQLEVATNVRSFAMMLLLTIRYHLDKAGTSGDRVVLANVSKFPPKDFYNFPDGTREDRFYHEPEFFGTYRRALSAIARHPNIVPLRMFLCGSDKPGAPTSGARAAPGADSVSKIAFDCAFMNFLPIPLTFNRTGDEAVPDSLKYLADRRSELFRRMPEEVTRVLVAPHSRWMPEESHDELGDDRDYHSEACSRAHISRSAFRQHAVCFRQEATKLIDAGLSESTTHDDDPAGFRRQLNLAWEALVQRCLSFGWPEYSGAQHENTLKDLTWSYSVLSTLLDEDRRSATGIAVTPNLSGLDVSQLSTFVKPYLHQYVRYLGYVLELQTNFTAASAAESSNSAASTKETQHQADRTIAERILTMLSQSQAADGLDKYLQLVMGNVLESCPAQASTGLELGYAENWLHRALIFLEAESIRTDVKSYGPIPLWKLLASDLCGMIHPGDEPDSAIKTFIGKLSDGLRFNVGSSNEASRVLNEFLLVGIMPGEGLAEQPASVDLDKVEWKALIGTYINEPFHTCRIKFDFEASKSLAAKVGTGPAPQGSMLHNQGSVLQHHVNWLKLAWGSSLSDTNVFKTTLRDRWDKRVADEKLYRPEPGNA